MAPRENQSQAPDLGASVQLEDSQTLENVGDGDGLDAGYVPPDRPFALDEPGVTGAGMRDGDTLDERLRREQGEEPADPSRSGRLTAPEGDVEGAGDGAARPNPDTLDAVDVGIDGGAATAEEAAMHEVPDAWIGSRGAPVETEPSVADAPGLTDPELDAALAADPGADRAAEQARRDVAEADATSRPVDGDDLAPGQGG